MFHYRNTEKRLHRGKHVVRRVHVTGDRGFKSVSTRHQKKMRTVKKPLTPREICQIKKRKFIRGLFDDCALKII